jgi:hypothetical protein
MQSILINIVGTVFLYALLKQSRTAVIWSRGFRIGNYVQVLLHI